MTRTWHNLKQLRNGHNEVNQLWNEEEKKGFAKVSKDSNSCKGYTCRIGECISNKYACRIAVVVKQSQGGGNEGSNDKCRKDMVIDIVYT